MQTAMKENIDINIIDKDKNYAEKEKSGIYPDRTFSHLGLHEHPAGYCLTQFHNSLPPYSFK
jgi:hypothetical protein